MLKLKPASLDWALAHVFRYGDTDMLPVPFEFNAIKHDWAAVRDYLAGEDVLEWEVRPHRALLAPKARYGFRVVTQLDPLDFMVFAALVHEIAEDVETRRVEVGKDVVFSYRVAVATNGQLFAPSIGYDSFRERATVLAEAKGCSHVAVTDIADFYPRIYSHRLAGALNVSTLKTNHVTAIERLLSGWNGTESFGIPVGNQPSRVLAETHLIDVDEALLAAGVKFIRYNDDYRIFADSHAKAYRHLAFLADVLYRSRGLTLQLQKTTVLAAEEFKKRFLSSPEQSEVESRAATFQQLVDELGLNPYDAIDYASLNPAQKEKVDSLNLKGLLREEASRSSPDFMVIRFVLRRMAQLGDASLADELLNDLDRLYPAFADIIQYLQKLHNLTVGEYQRIGGRVLDALEKSIVSELDYHRVWGLDLFSGSTQWNHADRCFQMLGEARDPAVRSKLILAIGRAHQRHWFQAQWRNLFSEAPWPRRALIAAASCLAQDARKHWYNSIESRLDRLETAVMRWAKSNPF
ncbi:MAG: RNA-directed DNA polymerase [Terriglobia bacterium]